MENVLEIKDFFVLGYGRITKKPKKIQSYFKEMKTLSKNEIISILKQIY